MSGKSVLRVLLGAALLAFRGEAWGEDSSAAGAGRWSVRMDEQAGSAVIQQGGRPLLEYAFHSGQYKPFVRGLHTLDGRNVLRDAPPDHLHHHGLMLALRVNGVNFWEEREPAGRQVPEGPPTLDIRDAGGPGAGHEATLTQWIRWQPAGVKEAHGPGLLRERRLLRLSLVSEREGLVLDWVSELRAERGTGRVVLHGPDYHGLGMRLPADFDHVAAFQNGLGLPYSEAQTYDVRPGLWTSVTGPLGAGRVQLVLAGHPGNPGQHAFFSMRNAFAYLAATPEPSRAPLEFREGERITLRYRLWVHSTPRDGEHLERAVRAWIGKP